MKKYAQIDANGVVFAIVETSGEIPTSTTILDASNHDPRMGQAWDGTAFNDVAPPVAVDPCEWFIDLGPFYDRFGAAKMAVLTSADAGVKAIVGDTNIRKWIDLERADVASGLAYIGSVVPELTPALQTAILTTPVTAEENMALRKLYFR